MDIFVRQLRKAMFAKDIRQSDLVRATRFTDGQISAWYNGKYRPNAVALSELAKVLGVTIDYLLGKEDIPIERLIKDVPVIGEVAAGLPIVAQEDLSGGIPEPDKFSLRIRGDSMSPRILDGDIVTVKKQNYAEDGDLVIALIDGEATCKVFKKSPWGVTLIPFNSAFQPLVFAGGEAEEVKILGKVVESIHKWS